MEENKDTFPQKTNSPLVGSQTKPTILQDASKLDIDTKGTFIDNILDASVSGGLDISQIENFTTISNSRDQIYQMIDTMSQDSLIAAILKTYTENICETGDNGHIVWCEATDPNISKFVNYLLNVMNVDKNIYNWVYSLLKYGDVYLRLYRESDYEDPIFKKEKISNTFSAKQSLHEDQQTSLPKEDLTESVNVSIHAPDDLYSYYVEMIADPGTMFELVKYGKTYGYVEVPNANTGLVTDGSQTWSGITASANAFNFKLKSSDVNIYQADDFVHACLEDNFTRFPEQVSIFSDTDNKDYFYQVRRGKSILYDKYKVWREKALLENAALLSRITRSSMMRKVSVEVGDMPKEQVQQTLRRVKELMEQRSAISAGQSFSEYQNPGPVENNIYFATHNGQGAISVESIGGDVEVKNLADLDWWNNKLFGSFGIPKQYFSYTDDGAGFNGGTSLSITSSIFAKAVKQAQNAIIQALTDAINLFLLNRGCMSYLNNFVLKMQAPVTQEEIDYRASITNRINAISSLQGLFTDVEDKARRLEILKSLLKTLNYGDELLTQIDQEIDAIKTAEEEAEAQAAAEAEAAKEMTEAPTEDNSMETVEESDTDLPPMEGFTHSKNLEPLVENNILELDTDAAILKEASEENDLTMPEDIDFTDNTKFN